MKRVFDPPATAASPDPFLQTIRLLDGEKILGQTRWISSDDATQGVAQILELCVAEKHRRQGLGRLLMDAVEEQARKHFEVRHKKLRRLWLALDQKRHVNARAFLMQFTFHHVGTVKELLHDQDLLIYMRTFD